MLASVGLSLLACRRAPPEPVPPSAGPTARSAQANAALTRYRPELNTLTGRLVEAVRASALREHGDDAGGPFVGQNPTRLNVCDLASVDIVAVQVNQRWHVAAVEPTRIALGIEGAERVYQLREEQQRAMSASEMAQCFGALMYYPYRVFDGQRWSDLPQGTSGETLGTGETPTLAPRPQGGRDVTFGYYIPNGQAGAGPHLAHVRVTDSRMLIDQAPNPERR